MSTGYHVNIETGEYGVCKAEKVQCPLGDKVVHVGDKESAIYESEIVLGEKLGLFQRAKKVSLPTVNTSYSIPQADRLDRLAEVVDAIKLGSHTSKDLSSSINTVPRQALYYADAAGYLGLVDYRVEKNEKNYFLTKSGESFAEGTAEDRDKILRHAVSEIPVVKVLKEKGDRAARQFLLDSVGDETVDRRMTTIKGWASKLNHTEKMVSYDTNLSEVGDSASLSNTQLYGDICPSCFTTKSLTGQCDNCD